MSAGVTVFVSGASGYIAAHVIHALTTAGYSVRGSVRSIASAGALARRFPGLTLVEADLKVASSFDAAVAGCTYVIHTASPFVFKVADLQADLLTPAVEGTLNVLRACKKGACLYAGCVCVRVRACACACVHVRACACVV